MDRLLKILALGTLLLLTACQQRCQLPPAEPIRTLAETQWRLVDTTDPDITFDNYNFLILNFRRNFTGDLQEVQYNDLIETPQATFRWNVEDGYLLMAVQRTSGGTESQFRYDYSLGSDLEMYEGGWHLLPVCSLYRCGRP